MAKCKVTKQSFFCFTQANVSIICNMHRHKDRTDHSTYLSLSGKGSLTFILIRVYSWGPTPCNNINNSISWTLHNATTSKTPSAGHSIMLQHQQLHQLDAPRCCTTTNTAHNHTQKWRTPATTTSTTPSPHSEHSAMVVTHTVNNQSMIVTHHTVNIQSMAVTHHTVNTQQWLWLTTQ